MAASFVLPLCPLEETVLLPGGSIHLGELALLGSSSFVHRSAVVGSTLVASLRDGDTVHEVGVTAAIEEDESRGVVLRGIGRCKLVNLVDSSVPLVRAERYPDGEIVSPRARALASLLATRYLRLRQGEARTEAWDLSTRSLSSITWLVVADAGLTPEQQQGFLNVPDSVSRGRLLLAVLREMERQQRFLRRWAHLRSSKPWN